MKTIREFAILCGTTEKTLRYYDRIGILRPTYTDPENGYRYYTEDQCYTFKMIRQYKSMGFTISEIRQIWKSDPEKVGEMLQLKKESLQAALKACEEWIEYRKNLDRQLEDVIPVVIEETDSGRSLIFRQGGKVCRISGEPELIGKVRQDLGESFLYDDPPPLEWILPLRDLRIIHTWSMKGTVKEILAADREKIGGTVPEETKFFYGRVAYGRRVDRQEVKAVQNMLRGCVYSEDKTFVKHLFASALVPQETDTVYAEMILMI